MPKNESCKNLCKYQKPVLVMAAELLCKVLQIVPISCFSVMFL